MMQQLLIFLKEVVKKIVEIFVAFCFALNIEFRTVRVFCILDTGEFWIASGAEFLEYLFLWFA